MFERYETEHFCSNNWTKIDFKFDLTSYRQIWILVYHNYRGYKYILVFLICKETEIISPQNNTDKANYICYLLHICISSMKFTLSACDIQMYGGALQIKLVRSNADDGCFVSLVTTLQSRTDSMLHMNLTVPGRVCMLVNMDQSAFSHERTNQQSNGNYDRRSSTGKY